MRAPETGTADACDAITRVAKRHFTDHGLSGASVTEIARDAGVSKALIFFHFSSKLGLFEAIASQFLEACTGRLSPIDRPEPDPEGRIRETVLSFHEFIEESEGLVRLILAWFLRGKPRKLSGPQKRFQTLHRRFHEMLSDMIEDGVARKRFAADVNPEREASVLLAGLVGLFIQRFTGPTSRKDTSVLYEHLLETTLSRLRRVDSDPTDCT